MGLINDFPSIVYSPGDQHFVTFEVMQVGRSRIGVNQDKFGLELLCYLLRTPQGSQAVFRAIDADDNRIEHHDLPTPDYECL
jgi:hypothetical protein